MALQKFLYKEAKFYMQGGLFIALYDESSLNLYLKNGIYGFLMNPIFNKTPSARSKHYAVLADYACCREGTEVFFFLHRKIVYGGKIVGNKACGSFYLNGSTSPLGRKSHSKLFWDESTRYTPTDTKGVFQVNDSDKSQPFILQFEQNENTGKYIISDALYFELGKYPYPLPSNSMQGMGFCTLTPGETATIMELIQKTDLKVNYSVCDNINRCDTATLFNEELVSIHDSFINEAQLEFTILSSLSPFEKLFTDEYILCRQVPISPFKPMSMDRADICLYSKNTPIKDGTIPNIVIELKNGRTNFHAYEQVVRYMKWLDKITTDEEFSNITAYVIANSFSKIRRNKIDTTYENKIKIFSLKTFDFVNLS